MIRIERATAPAFFSSKLYSWLEADLEDHFRDRSSKRRQSSHDWKGYAWIQREVRADLLSMFRNKCAYCESPVGGSAAPELESYRPRRGARGFDPVGGESSTFYHDAHYWWLALSWDNMLIACQACNRFKASWFPLEDESRRAPLRAEAEELVAECPLLLDPCSDDPLDHLLFAEDGTVIGSTTRGQVTVDLLKLNRSGLVADRRGALVKFEQACSLLLERKPSTGPRTRVSEAVIAAQDMLLDVLMPETPVPHAGALRQYLSAKPASQAKDLLAGLERRAAQRARGPVKEGTSAAPVAGVLRTILQEGACRGEGAFATAGESARARGASNEAFPPLGLGTLALEKIELHNFKNISDLTIEVPLATAGGGAPWLLFLGENAVGKSSILQAIVLTLMGGDRTRATGVRPNDVLRFYKHKDGNLDRCPDGYVKIWVADRVDPLTLTFRQNDEEFGGNVEVPSTYLLAYGPTRLFPDDENPSHESAGRVRVRNLFRPSVPLADADRWLFGLWEQDEGRHGDGDTPYNLVVRAMRQLLLMTREEETFEPDLKRREERRMLVHLKNQTTTIANLSDGYRTILALAADLMYMLHREGTSMEEAEGITVVDEIGTNLHPGWKKRIVSCFRSSFPKIQFIVTTHEPLCLRGLQQNETVLLRRGHEGRIAAITNLPNPGDLRVDELLASEFFGLNSTLESDVDEVFEEYYALLSLPRSNRAQRRRMAELKERLREREHLGHGLRDELMFEVIDQLIAEHLRSPAPRSRPQLKKVAVEKVLEAWKAAGLYEEGHSEV